MCLALCPSVATFEELFKQLTRLFKSHHTRIAMCCAVPLVFFVLQNNNAEVEVAIR